jgi:dTDP-4-dehydrorhamnose reductase
MKYLIVGASGFIGGNILSLARESGIESVGTRVRQAAAELLRFDLETDRIDDCVDRSFFRTSEEVCVIICAVVSNMDTCLVEKERSHRINVENTITLIKDVSAHGAKVIFASTCFVFDGTLGYYCEEHPVSPVNEYARHKVEVERYLQQQVARSLILRLEKVVGDDPAEGQLFTQWHNLLQAGEPIVCIEGSLLAPTYVKDVAKAFLISGERDLAGLYHVCNSEFFYRDELARQFCHAMGYPLHVQTRALGDFGFADARALKSYLDGSRFAEATGLHFTPMRRVFQRFRHKLELAGGSMA